MKIAYFTDTYAPELNGVVTSIREFGSLLSRRGHEIKIYCPSYSSHFVVESRDGLSLERHPSTDLFTYKHAQVVIPNYFELRKSIELFAPDIIHVHSAGVLGMVGVSIGRKLQIPVVGTYHTIFAAFTGYFSFSSIISKVNQVFKKLSPHTAVASRKHTFFKPNMTDRFNGELSETELQKFLWYAQNTFYGKCDIVISPSAFIQSELAQRGFKKEVVVVSNGIDVSLFPQKERAHQPFRTVIHVGRMGYEKHVHVILKAFRFVLDAVPDARFLIVGGGPALEELKELSVQLSLQNTIEFTDWIDRDRISRYYQHGDIFVSASTMETQGLVFLEAMSTGLPVVGVRKSAIPDLVTEGYNGFLAPPFDEQEIARYVVQIMRDPSLARELSNHARETALAHDIRNCVEKLESVYANLITMYA